MNATTTQSIYPAVRYENARAAIAWLTSALGFEEHEICPGEGDSIAHAELSVGGNLIMLGSVKPDGMAQTPKRLGGITGTVYVALATAAEVDERYARVKKSAAEIVRELCDTDYGSREFSVRDPEGHVWSFGTYRPQST